MSARSILIVEDSEAERQIYRWWLSEALGDRYRFTEVSTLAAAREEIERSIPDCLVLDYLLPDGTGVDLLHALADRECGLDFPVVMLTGEGSEAVAVEAMKAGAHDYVVKASADSETLLRAVESALEKGRLERELARRTQELEQLAYVVSHDLRSPLRSVHQSAELLQRSNGATLDDTSREHLARILASTRRMERLIVDLVAYCRLGATPCFEPVELGELVDQVVSDLEAQVIEAGAEIEVGELPQVTGDTTRLRQLFQNLIGNAMKFRRDGSCRVSIDAERIGSGWRIAIADDGIGIDARHFERIFRVFERLPETAERPGSGIGLATCRKIVELHGGTIEVESTPGVGTRFEFTLADGPEAEKEEPG